VPAPTNIAEFRRFLTTANSARIDDELAGIGPTKEWAGNCPEEDGKHSEQKRGQATELLLDPSREASED
jgi:hypothetical protein